ncbi:FAD-dependent oxidoreductase [Gulosibacter macacae]|uniref:FAD-dependent oxidoreductase n=1 Tax=Gulosibacter macacae TaxID=2488791 RepID=A0A3P3VX40_9MICO|nr:FAD-dependent oxidoreductase [Gulosibacter macacae]RRJ87024.1 FAD-dependent oxidoreductase [Gulosibacter macacae]
MNTSETFDLVVLGAGIAGLTTATAAAERGLRVALVEKTEAVGGSSAMSGGWFAFSGTPEQDAAGVDDSAELFLQDMLEVGEHRNDKTLLDAYLARQEQAAAWLRDHGAVFTQVEISSGQSAKRSHLSDIKDVLAKLHAAFEVAGGTSYLGHRATRLVVEGERVVGVQIEAADGILELHSRGGVVIATGGFSRGSEMLKVFAPDQLAAIPYGGKGNTGDGLRMAWRLGAGMADMSFVSGTYGSHPDTTDEFHELLTAYYLGAIIVNQSGERFTDEAQSYKTLGREVLKQQDGLGYQIFDATVRAKSERGVPLKDMDTLEDIGHLHRADTLAELADIIGVDADALAATVEAYNRVVGGETVDPQGRTSLCNGVGELKPIAQAPFFAYPAKSLMTTTYCGVTITPQGEVTNVDGEVIDGLYAVGEVTGGFHGAAYMTGTSLGKGAVFGNIVAETVATRLGESQ